MESKGNVEGERVDGHELSEGLGLNRRRIAKTRKLSPGKCPEAP